MKQLLTIAAITMACIVALLNAGCGTGSVPPSTLVPKPTVTPATPTTNISFDSRGEVIPPTGAMLSATNGIAFVPYFDAGLGMSRSTRGGPGSSVPTYCKFDGQKWLLAPGQYQVFVDTFASARSRAVKSRGGIPDTISADFSFKSVASTQILNSPSNSQHILDFNYAGDWAGGVTFAVGSTLQYCTTKVKVLSWEEVAAQPVLSLQLKNHVDSSSWNSYHESNTLLSDRDANGFLRADTSMAMIAVVQVDSIYTSPSRGGGDDVPVSSTLWDEVFISGRNLNNSITPSFHFTGGWSSESVGYTQPFAFDSMGQYEVIVTLLKGGKIVQSLVEAVNMADGGGK